MIKLTAKILLATGSSVVALAPSMAQSAGPIIDGASENIIVVTAQKRDQNINDVPISISVLDAEQLTNQGIRTTEDLARAIPGLSFSETQFDAPVFTLRGVGYNESSLAASPAVTVYVDQVPLPYPVMARGGVLDLERVEVLKGPQGTLFGQNSTGGAINYVAARPTDEFSIGGTFSLGRFWTLDGQGFVSGPITSTLRARVSASVSESGNWQSSTTRDDGLGRTDLVTGRLLLEWTPAPELTFELNINGWHDGSDTPAAQLVGLFPANGAPLPPAFTNAPIATTAREADWTPGLGLHRDNSFYQIALRSDFEVAPDVTITSITAFQRFDRDSLQDADGLPLEDLHIGLGGDIESFTQELRLAGRANNFSWIVGGNYQNDDIFDFQTVFLSDSPASFVGPFQFRSIFNDATHGLESWAVFANGELEVAEGLSLQAGARYTHTAIEYSACTRDTGAGDGAAAIGFVQFLIGAPVTTQPGACVTLLPDLTTGLTTDSLVEDNVSWRAGISYQPGSNMLFYANVSQGYKAGSFPTISASSASQLLPVTQERLVAYEAGIRLPFANDAAQFNAAAFYYDYTNKQLSGRIQDPFFGQLQNLVNVPRSDVVGFEAQLSTQPIDGLNLSGGLMYLDARIRSNPDGSEFVNFDQFGSLVELSGNKFPYTPDWQINLDAQYEWGIGENAMAFVGAGLVYRSSTKSGLEDDARLIIDAYTLVDLRAGIRAEDERWTVSVYGRNVFNEYYWNNVLHIQDTIVRYPGRPAEYGISAGFRF